MIKKYEETGILWEPELHFIPKKYFKMALKLGQFMKENNIREIHDIVHADNYYTLKNEYRILWQQQ